MVNFTEWLVSMSAVRIVVGSALIITALALLVEITLFMGALFMHF